MHDFQIVSHFAPKLRRRPGSPQFEGFNNVMLKPDLKYFKSVKVPTSYIHIPPQQYIGLASKPWNGYYDDS